MKRSEARALDPSTVLQTFDALREKGQSHIVIPDALWSVPSFSKRLREWVARHDLHGTRARDSETGETILCIQDRAHDHPCQLPAPTPAPTHSDVGISQ